MGQGGVTLPPLREVIATLRPFRRQGARPELPARSAPIARPDRPRARHARSCARCYEVGPGPGGLTRALLAAGCPCYRGGARPALLSGVGGAGGDGAGPARHNRRRCARDRRAGGGGGRRAYRRQPALQCRHRAAGALAGRWRRGRLVGLAHAHVPEGGRRTHRRPVGYSGLWAAYPCWPNGAPSRASPFQVHRSAFVPPPKRDLSGGPHHTRGEAPCRGPARLRTGGADRGRVRPKTQDVAAEPEIECPVRSTALDQAEHRSDPSRGNPVRRRICRTSPRILSTGGVDLLLLRLLFRAPFGGTLVLACAVTTAGGGPFWIAAASWIEGGQAVLHSWLMRARFTLARSTAPFLHHGFALPRQALPCRSDRA